MPGSPRAVCPGWLRGPLLAQLTGLDLRSNQIGPAGTRALAGHPAVSNLTYLNLNECGIETAGVEALAGADHLAGLRSLALAYNKVGPEGAIALPPPPPVTAGLRTLSLRDNAIGDAVHCALLKSPHAARWRLLFLESNRISKRMKQELRDVFGCRVVV